MYVPTGSKEAYNSTFPWSKYKNIEEMEFSGVEEIEGDSEAVTAVYYDLNGIKVYDAALGEIPTTLPVGVYIVRRGNSVSKEVISK